MRRTPTSIRGACWSPMNLAALSIRFCSTSTRRWRSPRTAGSPSATSSRTPRSRSRPSTRARASLDQVGERDRLRLASRPADARQLEQLPEQPVHAVGRAANASHVLLQLRRLAPERGRLDRSQEPHHRHERAAQVVGHRVGEALELGVALLELGDGALEIAARAVGGLARRSQRPRQPERQRQGAREAPDHPQQAPVALLRLQQVVGGARVVEAEERVPGEQHGERAVVRHARDLVADAVGGARRLEGRRRPRAGSRPGACARAGRRPRTRAAARAAPRARGATRGRRPRPRRCRA